MDFKGEMCCNDIYVLMIDFEVKLMCKGLGKEVWLCFGVYVVMENCYGLCVFFDVKLVVGVFELSVVVE